MGAPPDSSPYFGGDPPDIVQTLACWHHSVPGPPVLSFPRIVIKYFSKEGIQKARSGHQVNSLLHWCCCFYALLLDRIKKYIFLNIINSYWLVHTNIANSNPLTQILPHHSHSVFLFTFSYRGNPHPQHQHFYSYTPM